MTEAKPNAVTAELNSVRADELQERIQRNEPMQVIDVREFPEFAGGRIACAQLLPLGQLEARADELSRSIPLVCVCRSGQRSAEAVRKLRALGFGKIMQLEGGMEEWKKMRLPVTRDSHAPWSLERQVRFTQGLFVTGGLALSLLWPPAIVVAWIIGIGMMFTAVIDWCGLALLFSKAPWNRRTARACGK